MELYIYNADIELQGVIDRFSSLRWRRRYFEPGEFELHCPATEENRMLLQEDFIVHRLEREEAGIVEGITVQSSENGGDEIIVTGRMGASVLERRIVTPTFSFSGTVESAMRKIVSENALNSRPLPHVILGSEMGDSTVCSFQATGKTILSVCEALAKASLLGFHFRFDVANQAWIFEVCKGNDRSVSQTEQPYVLFSDEFSNIRNPKYTLNTVGHANYAYVAGQGEGSNRIIVEVDQSQGKPRRELWVDARDLQQREAESDAVYRSHLTQRGIEKLAEVAKTENLTVDVIDTLNFQYLTDWNLGDIVSMEKWGILLSQRITEVEEIYEGDGMTITPVCGTPLPETLDLGDDM